MTQTRIRRAVAVAIMAVCTLPGWAQATKAAPAAVPAPAVQVVEQPDAQRTKEALSALLERYPPTLRGVLRLDPALLGNQSYLAPYPALVNFLNTHPEVARNPSFYIGEGYGPQFNRFSQDRTGQILEIWKDVLGGLAVFIGLGMAISLLVWLIRTLVDYRRWSRLAKVQTDVHTKLLDRFTANEDLLAYIQSAPGARFLQSSPIMLDAAPRSVVGAPMARILWSAQGGVVLIAGGIGMMVVSGRVSDVASQPLNALGVLGIALGLGFVVSAIISYVISRRLGLIDRASRTESPSA
jgi:hypothetical protein